MPIQEDTQDRGIESIHQELADPDIQLVKDSQHGQVQSAIVCLVFKIVVNA
jgi:hypothetical protein